MASIRFDFSDEQGSGYLWWLFPHPRTTQEGNFHLSLQAGEFNLGGSSRNSSADGPFQDFTGHVNLPAPGSLALLSLGVLGWGLSSIRRR